MKKLEIIKWVGLAAFCTIIGFLIYQIIIMIFGLSDFLLWWTDDVANWWQQYIADPFFGVTDAMFTGVTQTFDQLYVDLGYTWDGLTTYGEAISNVVTDAVSAIPTLLDNFANLFSGWG